MLNLARIQDNTRGDGYRQLNHKQKYPFSSFDERSLENKLQSLKFQRKFQGPQKPVRVRLLMKPFYVDPVDVANIIKYASWCDVVRFVYI